ncbi:MAG: YqgE/AlgH family protein [Pseudomonadota bacterium]
MVYYKKPQSVRRSRYALSADIGYLNGKLLIAMPGLDATRFGRTVIYMCVHSDDGAMGIVLNQVADQVTFPDLLGQLHVIDEEQAASLPAQIDGMHVFKGGPVETGRGFVLHSDDYFLQNATLPIDDGICLTATLEILKAIADDRGPDNALLALGYAGWAPGQLESEIQNNGWLTCESKPDLVFDRDVGGKYERALSLLGIDLGMLSSEAGHA